VIVVVWLLGKASASRPVARTTLQNGDHVCQCSLFTYAARRETSLTDPDGNVTQWACDSDDRVTTLTEPNGHTVTYVYGNDGEVTDMTDSDGRRTTYSFDAIGQPRGARKRLSLALVADEAGSFAAPRRPAALDVLARRFSARENWHFLALFRGGTSADLFRQE
jgi:YD repeat-containing protein